MSAKAGFSVVDVELCAGGLLVDLGALRAQPLGGAGDQLVGGGLVDRLDLVEHDLLVGERQRERDRDLQRADRDVDRARLTPRISSSLLRMISSIVRTPCWFTSQLLLQVLDALAQREQQLLLR